MFPILDLPDLPIEVIINYLSYADLKNLILTSKRLKHLIYHKKFKQLHIFYKGARYEKSLFHTNETINDLNSAVAYIDINFLSEPQSSFKNRFNQLKKLTIYYYAYEDAKFTINLDDINHFKELVHFEISKAGAIEGKLELNHLKIVSFAAYEHTDFYLNCPKLEALKVSYKSIPIILNKGNIKHLSIGIRNLDKYYDEEDDGMRSDKLIVLFISLSNVTKITFYRMETVNFILENFNKHKKLRVNFPFLEEIRVDSYLGVYGLHLIKDFTNFNEYKFYINNQLFETLDQLIELDNLIGKYEGYRLSPFYENCKNLKLLSEIPIYECVFSRTFRLNLDKYIDLTEELICRFINIRHLTFKPKCKILAKKCLLKEIFFKSTVDENKKLLDLVFEKWNQIRHLAIESVHLDQTYYDKIPECFPKLIWLRLSKVEDKINNFDFIAKISRLHRITTDFNFKKETLLEIFKNSKSLRQINFFHSSKKRDFFKKPLQISREENKFYIKELYSKNSFKYFENINDLIDFYYSKNLYELNFQICELFLNERSKN